MKKLVIKLTVFLLIIFMILLLINGWFLKTNFYQNVLTGRELVKFGINDEANQNKEIIKFEPIKQDINIANFGASHGRASFDYSIFPDISGFNFGLSSQSLTYDMKMLEQFSSEIEKEAILIFPISYISLYADEFRDMETFESLNRRYYDILDYSKIQEGDLGYYTLNKISPILVTEDINYLDLLKNEEPLEVYNAKWYNSMESSTDSKVNEMSKSKVEGHQDIIDKQEIDDRMENAVVEIIEFCKENKFTPVFVTTPLYKDYNEGYTEEFYEKFYSDIEETIESFDVIYLDYSHDSEFTYDKSLFSDPDHLNQKGAQKFTPMVLEDIEKILDIELI